MQAITGSVGDGGVNNVTDVALVQAMLVKITRPAATGRPAGPYLASYDGSCGNLTKAAIKAFQSDKTPKTILGVPVKSILNIPQPTGLVRLGDLTWLQLVASVPNEFSEMPPASE